MPGTVNVAARAEADGRHEAGRRIVFVQSSRAPHHPRHHYRLAAALADAGFDARTLSQPPMRAGARDAVPVHALPVRRGRVGRMLSGPLTILRARRLAPELVYIVSLDLLPWAALLKALTGTRVMYDSSEQYDEYMLTKSYLPSRLRPLVSGLVRRLEPWLAARLDGATTAVPATQQKFASAGVNSQLVRNFPPRGLTSLAEDRGPFEYDVMVGGSLHRDGVEVLVRTAAELHRIGPPDMRWLAVCRNYGQEEKARLERALSEAGVRSAFDLRYDLPFQEVQQLTTLARVGLIGYPDRPYYRIALPLRALEYMAVGLPFVTGRFPLVEELLDGEEVGLLEPLGDASAYAAAVAELLADEPRRREMSARGPALVSDRLNWETEARKLVSFVAGVLE